jgi:hypothetical protein
MMAGGGLVALGAAHSLSSDREGFELTRLHQAPDERDEQASSHRSDAAVAGPGRLLAPLVAIPARATVTIELSPAADLFVDGRPAGNGAHLVQQLQPGFHLFEGRREGYRSIARNIEITTKGPNTVRLELSRSER